MLGPTLRALALVLWVSSAASPTPPVDCRDEERGAIYAEVARVLARDFFDDDFRRDVLPDLVLRHLGAARRATDVAEECGAVQALLAEIPVSHLALLSEEAHTRLFDELKRRSAPTFAFGLVELDGDFFASSVLEGGIAARAGIRNGDRILSLDGSAPREHPRLDRRTDDAALPDPPTHDLRCEAGDELLVRYARPDEEMREVRLEAVLDSAWQATQRSARVIEVDGQRLAYVHPWFIYFDGLVTWLGRQLRGPFADCDALVLDLRGRGGNGREALRLVRLLDPARGPWKRPVIALIDGATRSAKEIIASRLAAQGALLVGRRTAGAVIPATFEPVGDGFVLMFPSTTLGDDTTALEGTGVAPEIEVPGGPARAAGGDPILTAGLEAAAAWCRTEVRPASGVTPK